MQSKGRILVVSGLLSFLLILTGPLFISQTAFATAPELVDLRLDPEEPEVDTPLNVTAEFNIHDEPLTMVRIQWCIVEEGGGGSCGPMEMMSVDPSGRNFSRDYPVGTFQNATYEFHLYDEFYVSLHSFTIHVARKAKFLVINASMSPSTIHPNETITLSGNIDTDLREPASGAKVNVSIDDLDIFNTTTADQEGNFSMDLDVRVDVPFEGSINLNVDISAEMGELSGSSDLPLKVSRWKLPNMDITKGDMIYDPDDVPPGAGGNVFYTASNVTLRYFISNSGTAEAGNVTTTLITQPSGLSEVIEAGNLLQGERYPGTYELNTSVSGDIWTNFSVEWDQIAPFPIDHEAPVLNISYRIVDRPVWTGHTVFVEMFTQTTCAPCVYVEEALERLHDKPEIDFEYVVYVTEDPVSNLVAQNLGIITTPEVFIDRGLFQKSGSHSDLETDGDEILEMIEDAMSLETPPVELSVQEGDTLTLNVRLLPEYRESISGSISIYRIEAHSDLRNHQGIPMSHRFMGSLPGMEIDDLQPGDDRDLTIDALNDGEGIIAVLALDDGTVVQSMSYIPNEAPIAYLTDNDALLRIGSPEEGELEYSLDRFQTEEGDFGEIDYLISVEGLPGGWSVLAEDVEIPGEGIPMYFRFQDASMEKKPVGRVRYLVEETLKVSVPSNVSGTFDFSLKVDIDDRISRMTVVVVVPEKEEPGMNITSQRLIGEGSNIFFIVEATGVPEDGVVKGRVLPCNYGEGASCGIPVTLVLARVEEGVYRASVQNVDLLTYTHLTYNAWVEVGNVRFAEQEEIQVEIGSLVEIGSDDDEEVDDSLWPVLIFVISVISLIVIVIVVLILARAGKGKNEAEKDEKEPISDQIEQGSDPIRSEGMIPAENLRSTEGAQVQGPEDEASGSRKDEISEQQTSLHDEEDHLNIPAQTEGFDQDPAAGIEEPEMPPA